MKIQVYRKGVETVQLPLNVSTFSDALMGAHQLVFDFTIPVLLDIQVGDYITYKGERMTVNLVPTYGHDGLNIYGIVFQGVRHDLERWLLKDEGTTYIEYFGDLSDFMHMFIESVTISDSGWTLGELDETEPKSLVFDNVYTWDALTMIAELFELEWIIRGKQISVKKTVGAVRALSFAYGKGNGLYSLNRENIDGGRIITRAYAVGGSQNLPAGYGPKRLTMAGSIEDAAAIAAYGVREGSYSNDDIYPHRTGTISAIDQVNDSTWVIGDIALDFDLNGQRISGTDAQVVFTTGALNGQSFKILSYNHARKEIRYEANKDSNGSLTPAGLVRAEIGDKYTIAGIRMPQTYVDAALAELEEKAKEYLDSNKIPRVRYSLEIDLYRAKVQNYTLNAGDIINVKHAQVGLDSDIRVTSVSYPGHFPEVLENGMRFTSEIANEVTYNRMQKVEKDIKETRNVVTQVSRTSWENDRRNVVALNEFVSKVFDPDGNLQEPLIQAIAALFGTDSQYYDLIGIEMEFNVNGDPNAFQMTAGTLVHKRYEITGLGYIWELSSFAAYGLDPLKSYYLAAKCSQTQLTGEWVISPEKIPTVQEPGYWYFNLGVLSSVIEETRSFRVTKMFTMISGGSVETDLITAYLINVNKLFAQLINVGSQGFEKAGISGLADHGNQSVRFWAGAEASARDSAPFRVLNDGTMSATSGKVGSWNLGSGIYSGAPWAPNTNYTSFSPGDFLMRRNGNNPAFLNDIIEIAMGYLGMGTEIGARIVNNIQSFNNNTALAVGAKNGVKNIALDVLYGMSRLKGMCVGVQIVNNANTIINSDTVLVVVNGLAGEVGNPNLFMPPNADVGRFITVKNNSGGGCTLQANAGNGHIVKAGGGSENPVLLLNNNVRSYIFDGSNWIETNTH